MEVSSWENHRTKLWIFQHVRSEDTGGYSPMFHSYSVGISLCHLTSHQYPMFFLPSFIDVFPMKHRYLQGISHQYPTVCWWNLLKSPIISIKYPMKSPIIPIKFHETNDFLHIFASTKQQILRFPRYARSGVTAVDLAGQHWSVTVKRIVECGPGGSPYILMVI